MKLVIQIPCLNEEEILPTTLADLPRTLDGIDAIEVLVIDDGSRDHTSEVAREHGVTRVVRFPSRRGLAHAFSRGLQEALAMGADVIVNTDADNQYVGADIAKLVDPVVRGRADMAVGDRGVETMPDFSWLKKRLQKLGTAVVRGLSRTPVTDATSGFRAYSRDAAMRLTVVSSFTYTLETLLEAAEKGISVAHVPIRTNPKTRDSRLFTSMRAYVGRSLVTMARIYLMYQPARVLLSLSAGFGLIAAVLAGRFVYYYVALYPEPSGHTQSLLVAGVLAIVGVLIGVLGILADLIAINRKLLEEMLTNSRILRFDLASNGKDEHEP